MKHPGGTRPHFIRWPLLPYSNIWIRMANHTPTRAHLRRLAPNKNQQTYITHNIRGTPWNFILSVSRRVINMRPSTFTFVFPDSLCHYCRTVAVIKSGLVANGHVTHLLFITVSVSPQDRTHRKRLDTGEAPVLSLLQRHKAQSVTQDADERNRLATISLSRRTLVYGISELANSNPLLKSAIVMPVLHPEAGVLKETPREWNATHVMIYRPLVARWRLI
jgi:hypothetical protein